MGVIQEFFNNREIAIGIWVIIGLAVILPTKPARQFIKTAIPILFCKKFVIFYIVFLSFLGLVLFALNWVGLWDLTLLKDTVFWVLFVELPLFAKAIEKADGGRFFSKLIRENVAIVVAIEFFVGFWTFSLITEIILIPLTVLISVLQVLAGQDKKHRSVKRFFDGLLVLWGIILLINAIYSLIHAPNQFLSFDTLKSLLLPLVLLVFNLPVVYGLALYNTYEQIFIRIKGSKSEQKKMKWQVIRFSGINLVWDKGQHGLTMSDCELAYTSFDTPTRVFVCNRVELLNDGTIHPTQKPVKLYSWVLSLFARKGMKILDTHAGSGSSLIACYRQGLQDRRGNAG